MKKFIKIMALVLAMLMVMTCFIACAKDKTDDNGDDKGQTTAGDPEATTAPTGDDEGGDKFADIAGEYYLDGSALGMPMKWFVKITAAGKFTIATDREYTNVRGEGTVGGKDGTYMFVYSDSTNDNPKTATFTLDGKNLSFSTSVPIGSASVSPVEENGVTTYPTAKFIGAEEFLGTYMGTYTKVSAMAGSVEYSFSVVLGYGMEYTFESSFAMMGQTFTITETGMFAIDGEKITFTAKARDGEAVEEAAKEGTIKDKTITAAFKLSTMASEAQEVEAKFATMAEYANTYSGIANLAMGPMTMQYLVEFTLDAFGGYEYIAYDSEMAESCTESGTYAVDGTKITFTPATDGAEAREGTLDTYTIVAKFPISTMVTTPVQATYYASEIQGVYAAEGETEAGAAYGASLSLMGNEYAVAVANAEGNIVYVAVGTFEVKKGMVTTLELKATAVFSDAEMQNNVTATAPDEVKTISVPVSGDSVSASLIFDFDDTATIGFQFARVA